MIDRQRPRHFVEGCRVTEVPVVLPTTIAPNCTVEPNAASHPRSLNYRQLPWGAVPGYGPISWDRHDPATIEWSFRKRLFQVLPKADPVMLIKFGKFVTDFVTSRLRPIDVEPDFEDWVSGISHPEWRKNELRRVFDELHHCMPSAVAAQHVDSFVKHESYGAYKFARMINSRTDRFKAFFGPWASAMEKVTYNLTNDDDNLYFVKHMSPMERYERVNSLNRPTCRTYVTDFTAFESHFIPEFMRLCEQVLYSHLMSRFYCAGFICDVLTGLNRMRTRTGCRAVCYGRRMSGDMITSLGNGFSNLMLGLFIGREKSVDMIVEGDDGLISCSGSITPEDYARLGFTITMNEVQDAREGSFCGIICHRPNENIKDPRRVFRSFAWTHSAIHGGQRVMLSLLRAKAMSLNYEVANCPIVGALAQRALQLTVGVKPRYEADRYWEAIPPDGFVPLSFAPSTETRATFARLFGISPEAQLLCEQAIMRDDLEYVASVIRPTPEDLHFTSRYVVAG